MVRSAPDGSDNHLLKKSIILNRHLAWGVGGLGVIQFDLKIPLNPEKIRRQSRNPKPFSDIHYFMELGVSKAFRTWIPSACPACISQPAYYSLSNFAKSSSLFCISTDLLMTILLIKAIKMMSHDPVLITRFVQGTLPHNFLFLLSYCIVQACYQVHHNISSSSKPLFEIFTQLNASVRFLAPNH